MVPGSSTIGAMFDTARPPEADGARMLAPPFSTIPVPAAIRSDPNHGPCVNVSVARSRSGPAAQRWSCGDDRRSPRTPRSASSRRAEGCRRSRPRTRALGSRPAWPDRSRREPGRGCRRRSPPVTARRWSRRRTLRSSRGPMETQGPAQGRRGEHTPEATTPSQMAAAIAPLETASAPPSRIASSVPARSL